MFSKFPQKLTAPFGLLGDEAKLAFPSQPGGISKLWTARNISERDSYWEQYFILFDSASDVFSLITPHQIRRTLLEAPENVATLIRVVGGRLSTLLTDHTFPAPTPTATSATVAAFASSIMKAGNGDRNPTKEVLNCLRLLQRVLPIIFDVQGESNAFELELLWKNEEVDDIGDTDPGSSTPQFVIEDEDVDSDEENDAPKTPTPQTQAQASARPKKTLPSLGEKLFNNLIDLMFCCGFTLSPKIQVDHHKINYVIWEKGVGSTSDAAFASQYENNKVEVLRLLLVLLSRQIYVPAGSLFSKPSLYTLHFVQKIPRRDVLTILCSLLNTAMNGTAYSSDLSIGAVAGKLPYNHLVFKGEDPRVKLVGISFQVLCVLLDFQSGTAKDVGSQEERTAVPTAKTNAFRYFLMKLHRTQDFEFILSGVHNVMVQQMNSINNLLPGAKKPLPYVHEAIIFFWKMLELNKKFLAYFLDAEKCMDVVGYSLHYCVEIKDKPHLHGMCRTISYIVQSLSAEPAFGAKLTDPVKVPTPTTWNGVYNTGDFLIHAIYSIVATTSGQLNSIYPALIIALTNCAPYFVNIGVTASARLVQLFTSFANPVFLLADEGHPRLLFFMLEVFNSVIHYHMNENPTLTYDILTAHKAFEDLGKFTLASGLREVKRVQTAKEELAKRANNANTNNGDRKGKTPMSDVELADAGEEKAKLLRNESWNRAGDLESAAASSSPVRDSVDSVSHGDGMMSPVSEKARGKMRERRSSDTFDLAGLEGIAASVGRNGFVPTQEWVTSWQRGLPLDTVLIIISDLLSRVQELQTSRKVNSANAIREFLSNISVRDSLPPPGPVVARQFIWSDASLVWLTSLLWGEIYVRGMTPLGIWNGTSIKLFHVKHAPNQPRQITEAVTNAVGGFLRRTSDASIGHRTQGSVAR